MPETVSDAAAILRRLGARGETLAVAESCTGGLLAAAFTTVPGASAVFSGGIVAYATPMKAALLGVPDELLAHHGAVSEAVAAAMAEGAAVRFGCACALSTTGYAGPAGGTAADPVGTVYVGIRIHGATRVVRLVLPGDRAAVRASAVASALSALARELA